MKNVSFWFYGVVMILITMLLTGCYSSSTDTGTARHGKPGYDYVKTGSHFPFTIPRHVSIVEEKQIKECAAVFNFFSTQIPGGATVSTAKTQYDAGIEVLANAFNKNYGVRIASPQEALNTLYELGLEMPEKYTGYGRNEEERYVAYWIQQCRAQKMIANNLAQKQRRQEMRNSQQSQPKNPFSQWKKSFN